MDTSSKCEPCKKCLFLVRINYLVHTFCWFETPQGRFPPILRHLAAMPFPTASSMRSDLICSLDLPICFFPGHLRHLLNYVPIIQGDLGYLTCHVMLHNYISDPGFQHLKSSKPRRGDFRLSFFMVPLWGFGQWLAVTQSKSKKSGSEFSIYSIL